MPAALFPAEAAMARFFPDDRDLYQSFRAALSPGEVPWVLLVEGDLSIDTSGKVQTERLCPDVIDAMKDSDRLVGVVVTGSLIAPKATLLEPDIDWSPRVKVLGNMHVQSLCLGGSVFEVGGDLTAESTIFGFYNHGILRVSGRTRADVIFAFDYTMQFSGEAVFRYALGAKMNVPVDFAIKKLALAMDPPLLDAYEMPKEAEIVRRLSQGGSILKPKSQIGRTAKPTLSEAGQERLTAIAARAATGEAITEIDLTGCDLRFVPEDIRAYRDLRVLRLSNNNVTVLPDWLGEFPALEVLAAGNCSLTSLPATLAIHPRLRDLDLLYNEIESLPLVDGAFAPLETLRIGGGLEDSHIELTGGLDLARFPRLRILEQAFSGFPKLAFNSKAQLWNAPTLEYLDFGAVFNKIVPEGLSEAQGLRGLACSVAGDAVESALAVLPKLPRLEVLTLGLGTEFGPRDLAAFRTSLPGVYLRVQSENPFEADWNERKALSRELGGHMYRRQYADAAAVAERLFALVDMDRPSLPALMVETDLQHRLIALSNLALDETDPSARRLAIQRYVEVADRVLRSLPKTPDVAWWTHRRDLGLLRLDCLFAKVDGLIERGSSAGREEAGALLDTASAEVERHLADHVSWLTESRRRIGWRRGRLSR